MSGKINDKEHVNSKNSGNIKKKRFIVKYKDNVGLNKINKVEESITKKFKMNKVKGKKNSNASKIKVYELDSTEDTKITINELYKNENIDYVQEDYELNIFEYPSDPKFLEQWYLNNNGQEVGGTIGGAGIDINVLNAWKKTKGSADIVVGVLDTGVDIYHEDLKSNIYINSGEIPDNGIDDDLNGYIDDYQGWDFANDDNSVFDSNMDDKHGTHVSGIIAASENESGICGAAPNIKVLPMKFINGSSGYTSDVIEAIQYCKSMNIDIINCSWGCTEANNALKEAMDESGLTFICAAGNNGFNTSDVKTYPACFELPNIISVAAIDNKGSLASFSNYGDDIDIAAPGVRILSTTPNNSYDILSGTSMAAPLVTATLALLKSCDSNISQSDMIGRIKNCVNVSDKLRAMVSSGGSLNIDAVIENTIPDYIDNINPTSTFIPTPTPTTMYTILPANTPVGEKNIDEILMEPKDNSLQGNNKQIKPVYSGKSSENGRKEDAQIPKNSGLDTVCSNVNTQNILPLSYISEFEPNDRSSQAIVVNIGTVYGTANNEDDSDWYVVNFEANKEYTINLKNIKQGNDFGLYIYGPDLSFLADSDRWGASDELIIFTPQTSASYYINIYCFTYSNVSDNSYQLLIYPNDSLPDAYEANDSKETATSITQGINVNANININTDEDWYCVNTDATGKITVTLDNIPENCDYDIAIYNKSGAFVTSSSASGNTPEKANALISEPGEYYIRVYSWSGSNPTSNYNLKALISKPDEYEANDYIYQYKEIQLGDRVAATIDNLKDEDWFRVNISQEGDYIFALQNIPIGTDYDLYLYNISGDNICKSTLGTNSSEVITPTLTAGNYYIRILSFSGCSDSKGYEFVASEKRVFSMEFDRKFAEVGEIITATIKADNIENIAGFQANIVFDPKVLQVVNPDTGDIYTSSTLPTEGNILVNSDYQRFYLAAHDLQKGILNFGKVYQDFEGYKISGNSESTGTIAKIGFMVLEDYAIDVRFEELIYQNEGIADSIVEDISIFDWNGDKISDNEYVVVQPITVNPYSPILVNTSSVIQFGISEPLSSDEITVASAGSTKICGYIAPDFLNNTNLLSNFNVQVLGTGNSSIYDYTDSRGYFEINNAPDDCSYTLQISKNGYLNRTIKVPVNGYQIGALGLPIKMWAGDLAQDNAINMEDVIEVCKSYNTIKGQAEYNAVRDLNSDLAINLEDVMIVTKHYNTLPSDYDSRSPVAVAEEYDWYYFTVTDDNGVSASIYLSELGDTASTETVKVVAKRSDGALWCEYTLSGGVLSGPSASYAFDPVKSGDVTVASINTSGLWEEIKNIQNEIEEIKSVLINVFYDKVGFYPSSLDDEDKKMIATGIVFGVDDNLFFGLAHKILRRSPYDDDYCFMRAKTFTDAVFTAAYTTASAGSAVEAYRALQTAGAAGAMALATSETGVGGAAFGSAAVVELAEAAVMAGVSVVSGCLAGRSQGILKADANKLSSIINKGPIKAGDKTPKGRTYTEHGAIRANERGFSSQNIDAIIDNNKGVKQIDKLSGDVTWRFQDNRGNTVITSIWKDRIVTVYSYPKSFNGGIYIPK